MSFHSSSFDIDSTMIICKVYSWLGIHGSTQSHRECRLKVTYVFNRLPSCRHAPAAAVRSGQGLFLFHGVARSMGGHAPAAQDARLFHILLHMGGLCPLCDGLIGIAICDRNSYLFWPITLGLGTNANNAGNRSTLGSCPCRPGLQKAQRFRNVIRKMQYLS